VERRPRVVIDCDGPIFDSPQQWIDNFRSFGDGRAIYFDELEDWDTFAHHIGEDNFMRLCIHHELVAEIPFRENFETCVRRLSDHVDIVFVTALCGSKGRDIRKARLNALFPDIPCDFDTPRWELEADVLVDDYFDNVQRFMETPGRTALVWSSPWNVDYRRAFTRLYDNYRWVWSWADAYTIIYDMYCCGV